MSTAAPLPAPVSAVAAPAPAPEAPPATPAASAVSAAPAAERHPVSFNALLRYTLEHEASDLHLTTGERPWIRVHGKLRALWQVAPLTAEDMKAAIHACLAHDQRNRLEKERSVDAGTGVTWNGQEVRFRVNAFHQKRELALAIRVLPSLNLTFADLYLHPAVAALADYRDGLVIVSGPTGSGKSTTLAALINKLNHVREGHIITIEDPIEYHHASNVALVQQREVGSDVPSFAVGVRDALREDPNIMLIGEMRDYDTMRQAITGAETGHLVFSTLHTGSAAETISRILGVFTGNEGAAVRAQLAASMRAVVAQRLVVRADGKGRVPVVEILRVTGAVAHLLRSGRDEQIMSAIEAGGRHGMVSFEESAGRLIAMGVLKREDAMGAIRDEGALEHWTQEWAKEKNPNEIRKQAPLPTHAGKHPEVAH